MTTIFVAIVFVLLSGGQIEMVRIGPFQDEVRCEAGAAVFAKLAMRDQVLPVARVCVGRKVLPKGARFDV